MRKNRKFLFYFERDVILHVLEYDTRVIQSHDTNYNESDLQLQPKKKTTKPVKKPV